MTRSAALSVLSGVALYFLASQSQIGWLYVFDAAVWGLVALSLLVPWWSLRPLSVDCRVQAPKGSAEPQEQVWPVEDSLVDVTVEVRNAGRLGRYVVKVLVDSPLDQPSERPRRFLLPQVPRRSVVAVSYTTRCYRRGRYPVIRVSLACALPFGLFVRRRHFPVPVGLTVYPAFHQVQGDAPGGAESDDSGVAARSAAGMELYGSREYRQGDELRRIHWRNTARVGQLVVKEFEERRHGPLTIAFATRTDWGVGRESTLEYSIRIAASLARYGDESGRPVSILAGTGSVRGAGWLEAMDYLAGLAVEEQGWLPELAGQVGWRQPLVVVASCKDIEMVPHIAAAAGGGATLVLLEGFGEGERPEEFLRALGDNAPGVLRCQRGGLRQAVEGLVQRFTLDGDYR